MEYEKYFAPKGRIILLGFGAVGQNMLPMLLRHFDIEARRVLVIDKRQHPFFEKYEGKIAFRQIDIVRENMDRVLSKYLKAGDFLLNLALNIDGIAIVQWCLEHDILYLDTSVERWPDKPDEVIPELAKRTLYWTHQRMRETNGNSKGKTTCVITHGANPGLVSHFTKQALLNVARKMNLNVPMPDTKEQWAQLAKATGTKVIQIAERDTQVLDMPKPPNQFVNTWSCEGFWAEGRAPAEMGWGTHENIVPRNGNRHSFGPNNTAYLSQPGVATLVKSWVPKGGPYNGYLVQHSECITISDFLTTEDGSYRPTMYYAYQPCDAAVCSVHEMRGFELKFHRRTRIAKNSVASGIDELGVLLLGHGLTAYWYGSQLGIEETRKLFPGENPTTLQVCASILGAMVWAFNNPNEGLVEPDYMPFQEILHIARQYLGPVVGVQSDWTPFKDPGSLYRPDLDRDNEWSFENFRVD